MRIDVVRCAAAVPARPSLGAAVCAVACLTLLACGGQPRVKLSDDGIYRFSAHPIEVAAPGRCLLDMAVTASDQTVEFMTGRGFWEAGGRYTVHVFPVPGEVVDTPSFEARADRFLSRFLTGEPGQFGVDVRPVSRESRTVGEDPVVRAMAVHPGRAIFVTTVRKHGSRISVASLLYPVTDRQPATAQVPWTCYERFVESVRALA